jgi:hypothetical protein
MVERMLVDIEGEEGFDAFDLEIDESMSETELMVLLSQMVGSEPQTISVH